MKRTIIFYAFVLAELGSAFAGPYETLAGERNLVWPQWVDTSLCSDTGEPDAESLPIGQQLAIQLLGGAEWSYAALSAQFGGDPSSGWRLSDSAKDFSTMPRALDAQEGEFTKRLIDIAYSVATNGASVTRGGAVYSPLFTKDTGAVGLWGETWNSDHSKHFSASKIAVGPCCGGFMGENVSREWTEKFCGLIGNAGGDAPTIEEIDAELSRRRDSFRSSFEAGTGSKFSEFSTKSAIAKNGHGRLPESRDVRWSNWFARQFDTMFVEIPVSSFYFDLEEKVITNSVIFTAQQLRNYFAALVWAGPGDYSTVASDGNVQVGNADFRPAKPNHRATHPVCDWDSTYVDGNANVSATAIYRITSRGKVNDTGWVHWFTERKEKGTYDYFRRSWVDTRSYSFENANVTATPYKALRVNRWTRAKSWTFYDRFHNWADYASQFFQSRYTGTSIWCGYQIHRSKLDGHGQTDTDNVGNISYVDLQNPDMKEAVGTSLFDVAYEAYTHERENYVGFDGFRIYLSTHYSAPPSEIPSGRVKVVFTPNEDDPQGSGTETSFYDDGYHGRDPDPPIEKPETEDDGIGIPEGVVVSGDPDDSSGGGSGGGHDEDLVSIPVQCTVSTFGMHYNQYDYRTWSDLIMIGRIKFDFGH